MEKQKFKQKALSIFNNLYSGYDLLPDDIDLYEDIQLYCQNHGTFTIKAKYHIYMKRGCQKCGSDRKSKSLSYNTDTFTSLANIKHNNKYDYSLSIYKNSHSSVEIICLKHGMFSQAADSHLQGHGCKECDTDRKKQTVLSQDEVISRFKTVHGDRYDYSKTIYTGCFNEFNVICKHHGEFSTNYHKHYHLQTGCKKCTNRGQLLSQDEVVSRFKTVHGDRYDYSKFVYNHSLFKSSIICDIHGEFLQNYNDHYNSKHGCPDCAGNKKLSVDAYSVNPEYDYSKSIYLGSHTNIEIVCPIHGPFWQTPSNHIHNQNKCPNCYTVISKSQTEIYEFIKLLNTNTILEDRQSYPGLMLDITVPEKNLAIEYNGCYWHSINFPNTSRYHKPNHLKDKLLKCQAYGLRVINIYEDEWINSRPQMEQIIKNALGVIDTKIMARKCTIWSCTTSDPEFNTHITPFFTKFHHQGLKYKPQGTAYCLIYDNQIQACAYFGSNNYHNQNNCELIRYATRADVKVVGGLSRLIKNFVRQNPEVKEITSYCDARLFTGDGYKKSGFVLCHTTRPGFNVISHNPLIRRHRSSITKSNLKQYFTEDDLYYNTQLELAYKLKLMVVPDCGQLKFKLRF
jgi:hypothetical protein